MLSNPPRAEPDSSFEKVETLFELDVQGEVVGKPLGSGSADKLLLIVQRAERKSACGPLPCMQLELVNDRELEQRRVSPRQKAVRRIPGIGTWLLRTEDRIVDVEIERLIRASARTRVGRHQHVTFVEVSSNADLECFVAVVAGCFPEKSRHWCMSLRVS